MDELSSKVVTEVEDDAAVLWRGGEPVKRSRLVIAASMGFLSLVLFTIIFGITGRLDAGMLVGAVFLTGAFYAGRKDLREGYWMVVHKDRIAWRIPEGSFEAKFSEISQLKDCYESGWRVVLKDGREKPMPMSNDIYFEGYQKLYELRPEWFRERPMRY